jgi:hypothetical protein
MREQERRNSGRMKNILKPCTIYNGPTNALVCNKTLVQMSHTKTLKITPTCFIEAQMDEGLDKKKCNE